HYGALQGLDKAETAARHGEEQVKLWRRSYDIPPPPLEPDDPRHPRHDPRYAGLPPSALPATESLKRRSRGCNRTGRTASCRSSSRAVTCSSRRTATA